VRRRSSTDRRVVELEITARGRKAVEGLLPAVVLELNTILAPLTLAEFTQLKGALRKLFEGLPGPAPCAAPAAPSARVRSKRTRRTPPTSSARAVQRRSRP